MTCGVNEDIVLSPSSWARQRLESRSKPEGVGDSNVSPRLQIAMVWVSKLRSGRLTLHVAMQWKTPDGTKHDIYSGPWKGPRWHILNTIKKLLWGDSFPHRQFFFKEQPTTARHFITLGNRYTMIFGFDSISRLSIDSGSYWLLNLHGHIVGNRNVAFCHGYRAHGA